MFTLNSDISIGSFRFSGVHSVKITRGIHGIEEKATITIPSIAKVSSEGRVQPGTVITGKQFKEGDPVIIRLGYNDELKTEFKGFVKSCSLKVPLEVECEGYSWLLRRNKIKEMSGTVSLKDVLSNAVSGLSNGNKITVQCDLDLQFQNVQFKNECGFDLINKIRAYVDSSVTIFFVRPDALWCGLLYSGLAANNNPLNLPKIEFKLGYNIVKENSLRQADINNLPLQVNYSSRRKGGEKITGSSDAFRTYVRTHCKILSQIKEAPSLKTLANEKACKANYAGYEGYIRSFLQPFAEPAYRAFISDARYPELDAVYFIESVETNFGREGAVRYLEIGPRVGK